MGLKVGIVGLPNSGKSTIFNALTNSDIEAENYPFCTIDPNMGIVNVPDDRLMELAKIFHPKKITHTSIEFVDIAGLVKGASKGEGLGNQFLSHIRDVDAIIHVVRLFHDENVSHIEGKIDPIRDIEIIETELLLRDIISVEKHLDKIKKLVKSRDKHAENIKIILDNILPNMNAGILISNMKLEKKQLEQIKYLSLLTSKPMLYVANIDEGELLNSKNSVNFNLLMQHAKNQKNNAIKLCGKIESEIIILDEDEKHKFLIEFNLSKPGLNILIQNAYDLLELETFFTAGEKEVRAWTITSGMFAQAAAGIIHSDIERGFIKAEVYSSKEIIMIGSEIKLRELGKIRQEGKNYVVKDGDVIFFRFNV